MVKGKNAIVGQVIIMIFFVFVVVFLLIFGIQSTSTIKDTAEQLSYITIKKSLLSKFESMGYLELKKVSVNIPGNANKVCFLTNESFSGDHEDNLREKMISIYNEFDPSKNLLIFQNEKLLDALEINKPVLPVREDTEVDFICINKTGNFINFRVKSFGKYYKIADESEFISG